MDGATSELLNKLSQALHSGAETFANRGTAVRLGWLQDWVEAPPPDDPARSLHIAFDRGRIVLHAQSASRKEGCIRCAAERLTQAPGGAAERGRERNWLASLAHRPAHLAALTATLLSTFWADKEPEDWPSALICTLTGRVRRFHVLPCFDCPRCSPEVNRTEITRTLSAEEPVANAADSLRERSFRFEELQDFCGPGGLFHNLMVDLQMPIASASVEMPLLRGHAAEPTLGRAGSFAQAKAIAVLEGLERYCGFHARRDRTRRVAPRRELGASALDPRTLGGHPDACYDLPGSPYIRFSDDLELAWLEAVSLVDRRRTLVPECAIYWGRQDATSPRIFQESSNGCAVGSSYTEATLHAIKELVERDSLLLTWYQKLELPELDVRNDRDPQLRQLVARAEAFTDMQFRIFLSTMTHGFPSVWLMALGDGATTPACLVGANAHPDIRRAISDGISEMCIRIMAAIHHFPARRARAEQLLAGAIPVETMSDHQLAYSLSASRAAFDFLLRDEDRDRLPVTPDLNLPGQGSGFLTKVLDQVVAGIARTGLDVLVYDQTQPELERIGLVCVKAIIPGFVPMTFGHLKRRTSGLSRLADLTSSPYPSLSDGFADELLQCHPFD